MFLRSPLVQRIVHQVRTRQHVRHNALSASLKHMYLCCMSIAQGQAALCSKGQLWLNIVLGNMSKGGFCLAHHEAQHTLEGDLQTSQ